MSPQIFNIFYVSALEDDSIRGSMPVMGRITGSASIETLVRVGIEKENGFRPDSKMVVISDFMPCVDDELEVKRGQVSKHHFHVLIIIIMCVSVRWSDYVSCSHVFLENSQMFINIIKTRLVWSLSGAFIE